MRGKSILRSAIPLVAAGTCLALAACGGGSAAEGKSTAKSGGGEPVTLSFAYFAAADGWPGPVMDEWAKRVEEQTNGQVTVETYPGGTLLNRDDMFDGVLKGVADIGMASIADVGRFPLQAGIGLPVQLGTSTVASKVTYDLVSEFKPAELDEFKVITVFASGPAQLQTKQPIKSTGDLAGAEIRATGGGVKVLEKLGATPVGMSIAEVPEALQTGVIDGYMTSLTVLEDFKLAEMVKYVTNYQAEALTFAVLMDKDRWAELPPNVQKVIDGLGQEMAVWAGEQFDKQAEHALKWAKDEHGVEVVELSAAEKAKWDATVEPLVGTWVSEAKAKGLPAQEFLDRLYELRDQYSKK